MIDSSEQLEKCRHFVWQNKTPHAIELSIETLDWNGSESRLIYKIVKMLPHDANEQLIEATMQEICANSNYFGICALCKKPDLAGRMYDEHLCQSCSNA